MIKFCNELLRAHLATRTTENHEKFDDGAVIAARESCSDYLLRDRDDEIAKHGPAYHE
jgi:hypothetical protein